MKIDKAKKLSKTGKFHESFNALFEKIPDEIVANCTAKQLAIIVDLMRDQYTIGHDTGYKDAK